MTPTDLLDLALFHSATCYDLSRRSERQRSVIELEHLFFRILRELGPDLFIEAGAKDGATSRRARRYLPRARITAFEANPHTHARFAPLHAAHPEGISYLHRALSDADGTVSFNVRIVGGRRSADGQGSLLAAQDSAVGHQRVSVPASRLDSWFPPGSFGRCAIWMDVEGASEQVLTGGEGILGQIDALFIETQDRAHWDGQWLAGEVRDYLARHDLVPFARDYQSRYQYNVLFLNAAHLRNARIRLFLSEYLSAARYGADSGG